MLARFCPAWPTATSFTPFGDDQPSDARGHVGHILRSRRSQDLISRLSEVYVSTATDDHHGRLSPSQILRRVQRSRSTRPSASRPLGRKRTATCSLSLPSAALPSFVQLQAHADVFALPSCRAAQAHYQTPRRGHSKQCDAASTHVLKRHARLTKFSGCYTPDFRCHGPPGRSPVTRAETQGRGDAMSQRD